MPDDITISDFDDYNSTLYINLPMSDSPTNTTPPPTPPPTTSTSTSTSTSTPPPTTLAPNTTVIPLECEEFCKKLGY